MHFSKIKYATFILKTLKADEVVKKKHELEEIVITARKEQLLIMENHNNNPALGKINTIKSNYPNLRNKINNKLNDCINEIYIFKKKLKNNVLN